MASRACMRALNLARTCTEAAAASGWRPAAAGIEPAQGVGDWDVCGGQGAGNEPAQVGVTGRCEGWQAQKRRRGYVGLGWVHAGHIETQHQPREVSQPLSWALMDDGGRPSACGLQGMAVGVSL